MKVKNLAKRNGGHFSNLAKEIAAVVSRDCSRQSPVDTKELPVYDTAEREVVEALVHSVPQRQSRRRFDDARNSFWEGRLSWLRCRSWVEEMWRKEIMREVITSCIALNRSIEWKEYFIETTYTHIHTHTKRKRSNSYWKMRERGQYYKKMHDTCDRMNSREINFFIICATALINQRHISITA